jgi:hypothetical protein
MTTHDPLSAMSPDASLDPLPSAAHFLNDLIGKVVAVTLVSHDQHGQAFLGGVLTRVYPDAILLTQQNTTQLIFTHAIATVQEATHSDREFLASIANVQQMTNTDYQALAKYIGE